MAQEDWFYVSGLVQTKPLRKHLEVQRQTIKSVLNGKQTVLLLKRLLHFLFPMTDFIWPSSLPHHRLCVSAHAHVMSPSCAVSSLIQPFLHKTLLPKNSEIAIWPLLALLKAKHPQLELLNLSSRCYEDRCAF